MYGKPVNLSVYINRYPLVFTLCKNIKLQSQPPTLCDLHCQKVLSELYFHRKKEELIKENKEQKHIVTEINNTKFNKVIYSTSPLSKKQLWDRLHNKKEPLILCATGIGQADSLYEKHKIYNT